MKLFVWQLKAEITKMLARKRTFLGFGVFLVLETIIYWFLHREGVEKFFGRMIAKQGESFDHYYSALTLGFIVLVLALLPSAIFMTLVAGDVVAKESEDGNLRLILARPISRLRLLTVKYVSCLIYSFVLMQFIVWTVLLMGIALRGWGGGMFVFSPEEGTFCLFEANEGLLRFAYASLGLTASMLGASSIAFFLSCFRIKPAAATISSLAYVFMDSILRESRVMDNHLQWLITHYMTAWRMFFMENIHWGVILQQYAVLGGVSLTLFVLGALVFESRDIKS
jgi:ABC-2 type transport system permease protein